METSYEIPNLINQGKNVGTCKNPFFFHITTGERIKKSAICSELSRDSKIISGLSIRRLTEWELFFKVDEWSTEISYRCARIERLNPVG